MPQIMGDMGRMMQDLQMHMPTYQLNQYAHNSAFGIPEPKPILEKSWKPIKHEYAEIPIFPTIEFPKPYSSSFFKATHPIEDSNSLALGYVGMNARKRESEDKSLYNILYGNNSTKEKQYKTW